MPTDTSSKTSEGREFRVFCPKCDGVADERFTEVDARDYAAKFHHQGCRETLQVERENAQSLRRPPMRDGIIEDSDNPEVRHAMGRFWAARAQYALTEAERTRCLENMERWVLAQQAPR